MTASRKPIPIDRSSRWKACYSSPWRRSQSIRPPLARFEQPLPPLIQKTVKTGILSLVWLHVGVVAGVRGLEPAIYVAILWVPAYLLGRWLYST